MSGSMTNGKNWEAGATPKSGPGERSPGPVTVLISLRAGRAYDTTGGTTSSHLMILNSPVYGKNGGGITKSRLSKW